MLEHINKSLCDPIKELSEIAIISIAKDDFKIYRESIFKLESMDNLVPYAFSACVLSIYSIVEACLDRYCHVCCNEFELKLDLEDMKDKGITRSINYLEKVVQIERVKGNNIWKLMLLVNQIRNDIIHRAVMPSKNKITVYLKEISVETSIDGILRITYENALNIHKICNDFLSFVLSRKFLVPMPNIQRK